MCKSQFFRLWAGFSLPFFDILDFKRVPVWQNLLPIWWLLLYLNEPKFSGALLMMCKPQVFGLQVGSGSAKFASDRQASSPRIRLELDTSLEIDVVQYFMGVCMVTLNYALCTMALSLHTCGVVCLPKIFP